MSGYEEEVEKKSFEECMKELEEIVGLLESGTLDLETSIANFEKSVILRNKCKKILDESERRIQTIIETTNGIEIKDFKCD